MIAPEDADAAPPKDWAMAENRNTPNFCAGLLSNWLFHRKKRESHLEFSICPPKSLLIPRCLFFLGQFIVPNIVA